LEKLIAGSKQSMESPTVQTDHLTWHCCDDCCSARAILQERYFPKVCAGSKPGHFRLFPAIDGLPNDAFALEDDIKILTGISLLHHYLIGLDFRFLQSIGDEQDFVIGERFEKWHCPQQRPESLTFLIVVVAE
jgi:hypothetical protein